MLTVVTKIQRNRRGPNKCNNHQKKVLPQENDSNDGSSVNQVEWHLLHIYKVKRPSGHLKNIISRHPLQQISGSTNLWTVWIKEVSSTDGSTPSAGFHWPPIVMKDWSFLSKANRRILQMWGMRSSELFSDDSSSRAFLLSPLIKIIWTKKTENP